MSQAKFIPLLPLPETILINIISFCSLLQARNLRFIPDSSISFPHHLSFPNLASHESSVVHHGKISSGLSLPLHLHLNPGPHHLLILKGSSLPLSPTFLFHSNQRALENENVIQPPFLFKLLITPHHPWDQAQLYCSFSQREPYLTFRPQASLPLAARLHSRLWALF